jgi:hypothetical protein
LPRYFKAHQVISLRGCPEGQRAEALRRCTCPRPRKDPVDDTFMRTPGDVENARRALAVDRRYGPRKATKGVGA